MYLNAAGVGNVGLGDNTLRASTNDYNTAIGYQAGSGLTAGSYNIAIGAGTIFPSSTASNQLNIGNWIYGSG